MLTQRHEDPTSVTTALHSFQIKDAKGREIGARVRRYTVTYVAQAESTSGYTTEPGTYFGFYPHATRDGSNYGALSGDRIFKTEAEREAAIAKYLADAKKRAVKIAAKGAR